MEISCVEVNEFIAEQSALDKADNTVKTYHRIMNTFVTWLNANGGDISNLTRYDVQSYVKALENDGKAASTVDKVFACLSVYARYIGRDDVVSNVKRILPASKRNVAPKSLEPLDMKRILRDVERGGNLRDLAIVYTLLETGLRVSELCALDREDIAVSERGGSITVRDGKGGKMRVVPMSRDVRYHIAKYLDTRTDTNEALFLSNYKQRISIRAVQHMLTGYGTHPHALRHTFCRRLVSNGIDIASVADLAGHSDINVTRRYSKASADELANAIDQAFS